MQTILVVDDDRGIVRFLQLLLRLESFRVLSAFDGVDALCQLEEQEERPDLIVLDLAMPLMDGREFYHRARDAGYGGPVIVCSADGAGQACRELGAQKALPKPFDADELLLAIHEQLA